MLLVPRRVTKIHSDNRASVQKEEPVCLKELRGQAAWVLLGEPGAGKTKAFEMEKNETQGSLISIAEFLSDDPDPAWREKTLYLDGLDEVRASEDSYSILLKVRAHLRKLGRPRFRIACRAADWHDLMDRQDIANISQDGQLEVYTLVPLNDAEILKILSRNCGVSDPKEFVEEACKRGIKNLLDNPLTLSLLAEATQDGQWPSTRLETFELACRSQAIRHHASCNQTTSPEEILEAAGQLFTAMLFSGKSGIAMDTESVGKQFPLVNDLAPDNLQIVQLATRRKLFRQSADIKARVVPSHRSIAEFLAADWLAKHIHRRDAPFERTLNLFLCQDQRTVADLRNLYGWLASHLHSQPVTQQRLIEADPLTIILHSNIEQMALSNKRQLLNSFLQKAETQISCHWDILSASQFGALADKALITDFFTILGTNKRSNKYQFRANRILDILKKGNLILELSPMIRAIILDDTWNFDNRTLALEVWLKHSPPANEAIALLDELCFEQDNQADDFLIDTLLSALYPKEIQTNDLLRYLGTQVARAVIGGSLKMTCGSFDLLEMTPPAHLPILLDQLAEMITLITHSDEEANVYWFLTLDALIARTLQTHGDEISDQQLYTWLGMGEGRYKEIRQEGEHWKAIANWLTTHPARYKRVLTAYYENCEDLKYPWPFLFDQANRLRGAPPLSDIGLWHLGRASKTANTESAKHHLSEAVRALLYGQGCLGLSLEKIEAWGKAHPKRRHWLDSMLASEIFDANRLKATGIKAHKLHEAEQRFNRTITVSRRLEAIRNGTASPGIMHELANIWLNHHRDIQGNTLEARFENYCDNANEVLRATESGFFHCPERKDLPNVTEIIAPNAKQPSKKYLIRQPCLIGMQLRSRLGKTAIDCLSEGQLSRMAAFCLLEGVGHELPWFLHLAQTRSALVAEVLIAYGNAVFKSKQDTVSFLPLITHDNAPWSLANLVIIPLLTNFPIRTKPALLPYFADLLGAALRYFPEQLKELIKQKTALKGMNFLQRIYWLAAGTALDPEQYKTALWLHIGEDFARINCLYDLIINRSIGLSNDYELPASIFGKLIELFPLYAEPEPKKRTGIVTEPKSIYSIVTYLGTLASQEAAQEIDRLLAKPLSGKLKQALETARYQLREKQRKNAFRLLPPEKIADVLTNQAPVCVSDLAALVLDALDHIAHKLHGEYNWYYGFWETYKGIVSKKRTEDSCRLELQRKIENCFNHFCILFTEEGYYQQDNRSDLRLSYEDRFGFHIAIKKASHRDLWTAIRTQLIEKYANADEASGYGIYLVLWFGHDNLPLARDGKPAPNSPKALRSRLEALLSQEERSRIFVRVLDVSLSKRKINQQKPGHKKSVFS